MINECVIFIALLQMLDVHNSFVDDAPERMLYFWVQENSHLTHFGSRFGRPDHLVPDNVDTKHQPDQTVVQVADYTQDDNLDQTEPASQMMRGHELF